MSESTFSERARALVIQEWDILLVIGFLLFMTYMAMDLRQIPRQFPMVFLVLGLFAMTIELAVRLLPPKYGDPIRRMTTGIAAEMSSDLTEDDELESEESPDESIDRQKVVKTLILSIVLITGFGLLSYYISFLLALPIFVVGSMYTIGDKDLKNTIVTFIVLLLLTYVVFGDFLNVPIDSGRLIDVNELLR